MVGEDPEIVHRKDPTERLQSSPLVLRKNYMVLGPEDVHNSSAPHVNLSRSVWDGCCSTSTSL